jgi:RNA polymerase sigma factor (sigma-70 family)
MSSWTSIYQSLWETGQRIALAMLRGDEYHQEREDIVATAISQTVTSFLEKSPKSRNAPPPLSDLEGMMKTIVRRRLLDHLRQKYRRAIVPFDETAPQPVQSSTPADEVEAAELWQTIAELDPPLPDLFTDRFLLGWTTTEIAERRGLNANTVLSHFHRGFARLRGILTQRHEGTKE